MHERIIVPINSRELKKRRYPIKHPKNLIRPGFEDFGVEDIRHDLTDMVLHRIEHALHRDQKTRPKKKEQKLKFYARHNTFTPLKKDVVIDSENKTLKLVETPKGKKRLIREADQIKQSDIGRAKIQEKRRQASRLRSDDNSPAASQLREQAEMPYHKAHRVTISINQEEAVDTDSKAKIKKLRELLFTDSESEGLKTNFMGNLFSKNGSNLKQLTRFITGAKLEDMQVLFYGKSGKKLKPEFITLSEENFKKNGLTNQEIYSLFAQGLKEIPVVRICSPTGKVLLEIAYSYGKWSRLHPEIPSDHSGSWVEGEINFYHRQKNQEKKQIKQIFDRWLALGNS